MMADICVLIMLLYDVMKDQWGDAVMNGMPICDATDSSANVCKYHMNQYKT
jgi:hypothetical protein